MNALPEVSTDTSEFAANIRHSARAIMPDETFTARLHNDLQLAMRASRRPRPKARLLSGVAAALIAAFAAVLAMPSLRAFAQEIIDLLTNADSDRVTQEVYTPSDTQIFDSVAQAEGAFSLDFAEPQHLPSGQYDGEAAPVQVIEVSYTPQYRSLQIRYAFPGAAMWWMWLNVTPVEIARQYPDLVGESADIETISIVFKGESVPAQFVRGNWTITSLEEPLPPGTTIGQELNMLPPGSEANVHTQWDNHSGSMQLIWEYNGLEYELHSVSEPILGLDQDALIRVAESIE